MESYNSLELLNHKRVVDRYFNNCYKRSSKIIKNQMAFYTIRLILLIIYVPIDVCVIQPSPPTAELYEIFFWICLGFNLLYAAIYYFLYFSFYRNHWKVISMATEIHHTVLLEEIRQKAIADGNGALNLYEIDQDSSLYVSPDIYDFQNNQKNGDVTAELKEMRELLGEAYIKNHLDNECCIFKVFNCLLSLCSLGIFIFGMVISFTEEFSAGEHAALDIYLISEVLFRLVLFAVLVLIALSPIICIVLIICCCCCRKNTQAKLPQIVIATNQITQRSSECPICYQAIAVGDEVRILTCSNMHIFHDLCITSWSKVKATCPICRHALDTQP